LIRDLPRPEPFEVLVEEAADHGGSVRVRVRGEVDLATAVEVCDGIERARRRAADVTLDLRDVGFMDSTGVRMLIDVAAESARDGFDLAIAPSPAVREVLRLCVLEDRLPLIDAG
jgi:anti-sigma B factor antagonist